MQTKNVEPATAVASPVLRLSKEARALLPDGGALHKNALDQVSHAVYFR